MQTSVDRGQLRLLRIAQSRILDVLLVERGDVLVPEARDRHVKDVFRQNMERIRGWSSARLCDLHLAPRESHRMDHGTAYRHGWYVTLFGQLSRSELRGKLPERIGSLHLRGQSSSAVLALSGHHDPISQPAANLMLLRRGLPRQSVRPKGADESCLRRRR